IGHIDLDGLNRNIASFGVFLGYKIMHMGGSLRFRSDCLTAGVAGGIMTAVVSVECPQMECNHRGWFTES
ncbi:MAG: hypothetical protein EA424_27950, partial [Planctomycetaceae bacterium]